MEELETLSEDELFTLQRLGENNQMIAKNLHVTVSTVETRLKNIYTKVGLNTVDRRLRVILLDRAFSIFQFKALAA
jgi:DNA-binding NarL/FixJ family response regulator